VEDGDTVVLNANDNIPDDHACRQIRSQFGRVDLALLPYSGASEYPSCFEALGDDGRRAAAQRKIDTYLDVLVGNARILEPRLTAPFAGQYLLGGREVDRNPFLGIPTVEEACARLEDAHFTAVSLREGDELDLHTGDVDHTMAPDPLLPGDYEATIRSSTYWFDDAFNFENGARGVDSLPLFRAARSKLWRYQEQFDWFEPHRLVVNVRDVWPTRLMLDFSTTEVSRLDRDEVAKPPFVEVTTRYNLLLALLTRHVNWNNAAIGCHLSFVREPEVYTPEVFALLPYLHV
jgi:UDP-MurNAc hydroxylase